MDFTVDKTGMITLTPPKKNENWKPPTPRKGDRLALIIQRRGEFKRMLNRDDKKAQPYSPGDARVGSFDMEQALKNKELGYW